ncbi:KamA family radical SAM protein [Desulfovibrio mangrovi]|uniref:KamA family radical SAM protein n=1 Tax=Desulfovibrio mangrovi TaxID=2976983 RepID=UPI00224611EE|nr:KamA family radical SAM protein [Desulfovibrio mangrovi]UZP67072.1 KamA family radical SAM protein [Desulfovibrio mangrovi]
MSSNVAEIEQSPMEPPSLFGVQTPSVYSKLPFPVGMRFTEEKETPPAFAISERSDAFRRRYYPDVNIKTWCDWHWQYANRITSLDQLGAMLSLSPEELGAGTGLAALPLAITPYYAAQFDPENPADPLRRTMVPTVAEWELNPGESADPLGEDGHSPVPGLVHRYPDRVLFLATDTCAAYCRYCTRSRRVGKPCSTSTVRKRWPAAIEYIENHPEVRDVLISGGDPLTMSDAALDHLLSRLRRIPHLEIIRIGSKAPIVMPQRITPSLLRVLRRYHPLLMSIHCTHPDELTSEASEALRRLADAGIPLGSQTVLLKGINDDVPTMTKLMHGLLKSRVRPYYLYHCDPVQGSAHFRTHIFKGVDIIRGMRGHTSGYAVPTYVVDAPGGGGKIPLMPDYVQGYDGEDLVLRNYEGNLYRSYDPAAPAAHACDTGCDGDCGCKGGTPCL